MSFVPSPQNLAFFDRIMNDHCNIILEAVAGSGKSTCLVQALPYIGPSKRVLMIAFNKKSGTDLTGKIAALSLETGFNAANVQARTCHSFGLAQLRRYYGAKARKLTVETGSKKLFNIARHELNDEDHELYAAFSCKLVKLAKDQGLGALEPETVQAYESLIDHHGMELDSDEGDIATAIDIAMHIMRCSIESAERDLYIDFDDMIYLPILWNAKIDTFDFVFFDELQDTSPMREELAARAIGPNGRIVGVGDTFQAINGFAGASCDAMAFFAKRFNAVPLPLSVSYRCPQAIEALAQEINPAFSVHSSAPKGEYCPDMALSKAMPYLDRESAVLCRNTAPLVALAYQFIAQGVACVVLGRDIGKGLTALIKRMRAKTLDNLTEKLATYRARETEKLKGDESKIDSLNDKLDCLTVLIDSMDEKSRTIPALVARIDSMFSDDDKSGKLTLSTAHKSKGLEWKNIAILQPALMPSKRATRDWQVKQEMHLIYVARTRCKNAFITLAG